MSKHPEMIHSLTAIVLRAEKAAQTMYDNPQAEIDDAYFQSAEELERFAGLASKALQMQNTQTFQEESQLAENLNDLEDKVGRIEQALAVVENTAGAIQAASQVVASLRHIFGL
ncbi:MAG: hypothetical protein J0M35_00280 [Candidatus Obscuribacter phosphatis]|uniref:Uncharacterized protein n=1 Tax=Candidatus Obscuribacter phosphatis TaxID=1906157 RepID=A0A8J7P688_9BACT|nr:hypothetical protein [Candidatus Obscuribacter phosphatis]